MAVRRAKILLLVTCLFWAASFIASRVALRSIPPLTVVSLRLVVSALCFVVWFAATGRRWSFGGRREYVRLALLSLFGTGLHYGIQTTGLQYTTASNASLLAVTAPISITLIAALFLGERLTGRKVIGILLALGGVLLTMGIDTLRAFDLHSHLRGDLLVLLSILMWGIFTVLGKDVTRRLGAVDITAAITVIGAIYMLPVGLWEMQRRHFTLALAGVDAWLAVFFLGVTCSFLATLFYVHALEKCESQKVGIYLYTIPPMTYLIAAVYPGETIGWNLLLGSLVVLGGVYLTERG